MSEDTGDFSHAVETPAGTAPSDVGSPGDTSGGYGVNGDAGATSPDADDGPDGGDDGLAITSLRTNLPLPARLAAGGTEVQHVRWRMWYRLTGGSVLAALMLVGLFFGLQPAVAHLLPGPKPPAPVAFAIGEPHCVDDVVWSPDSIRIAALDEPGCNANTLDTPLAQRQAVLTLYDARTGRALTHLELGAIVARSVTFPPSAAGRGQIFYEQLVWLPGGRQIAVFFSAIVPPTSSSIELQVANGVALVPVAPAKPLGATGVHILLDPLSLTSTPIGATSPAASVAFERLDLVTGAVDILRVPVAVVYRWTRDDTLTPISLPSTTVARGAVGDPLGGVQFSLWQSGFIQYESANACDSAQGLEQYSPQDYYRIGLTTSSVSPDGRYFIPTLYAEGRLPTRPPQPSPSAGGTTVQLSSAPSGASCSLLSASSAATPDALHLPLHDEGLRAALALVAINAQPAIQFTWRPDGKRLAVAPSDVASAPALSIYDCATGKLRAHFSMAQLDALAGQPLQTGGSPFQFVRWSPDGARLFALPQGSSAHALIFTSADLGD